MNNIGKVLYGFCNGFFGRDHYHDCRIEGEGHDWIVVRGLNSYSYTELARFDDENEKQKYVDEWCIPEPNDVR